VTAAGADRPGARRDAPQGADRDAVPGAFFVRLGDGRFLATAHTAGPWDPRHQHAGPPSALLATAMDTREGMGLARLTVEILGPIPVGEVEVRVEVERPGRSVELVAGELVAGGRTVARARAWRTLAAPVRIAPEHLPPPLPDSDDPEAATLGDFGYAAAIEWRWADGGWYVPGPAKVWTRMRHRLIEGEPVTPLQRTVVVADSGNGVSAALDWKRFLFINPELSVHFLRAPQGEWVCLEARTEVETTAAATSVLSDPSGPVARGAQSLLVAPR
jgi:hypothetical protein